MKDTLAGAEADSGRFWANCAVLLRDVYGDKWEDVMQQLQQVRCASLPLGVISAPCSCCPCAPARARVRTCDSRVAVGLVLQTWHTTGAQ